MATLDVRGISPCAADCLRYLGIRSNYLGETVVGQKRMREDMNGRSKDYVTTGLKELEEKGIVTTIGRKRSDSQADKHIISRSILSGEYRKVLEALEANNPDKQENFPSDNPASQDDAFFNDPTERELENPACLCRLPPHLPPWPCFPTGNWDRHAVFQNQRDGDPAVGDVKSSLALGKSDQGFIGNAEELWERRQALDCLLRGPQRLFRDVDSRWSHCRCRRVGYLILREEFVKLTRQWLAEDQQRAGLQDTLDMP